MRSFIFLSLIYCACTVLNPDYIPQEESLATGSYSFFLVENMNTCDPNGPLGAFRNVAISPLDVDEYGQGSLIINDVMFPLKVVYTQNGFNISLTKTDCFFMEKSYMTDKTCNESMVIPNLNGNYTIETNRLKGEMTFDYSGLCGESGFDDGKSRITFDGNREEIPVECKEESFYCYLDKNCKSKIPSCKLSKESCLVWSAKSYRIVGVGECINL